MDTFETRLMEIMSLRGATISALGRALGFSDSTMRYKSKSAGSWNFSQVRKLKETLRLDKEELDYLFDEKFFTTEVD